MERELADSVSWFAAGGIATSVDEASGVSTTVIVPCGMTRVLIDRLLEKELSFYNHPVFFGIPDNENEGNAESRRLSVGEL